jgi:hypothetical protein
MFFKLIIKLYLYTFASFKLSMTSKKTLVTLNLIKIEKETFNHFLLKSINITIGHKTTASTHYNSGCTIINSILFVLLFPILHLYFGGFLFLFMFAYIFCNFC